MKWIRFEKTDNTSGLKSGPRLGLQTVSGSIVDLAAAAPYYGVDEGSVPTDIVDLLRLPDGARKTLLDLATKAANVSVDGSSVWDNDPEQVALLAPLARPGKIICIGLNYLAHAEEAGAELPKEPIFFSKYASAIIGPDETVQKPAFTNQLDYEVELAAVIGKPGFNIPVSSALDHVFGYTILNDVSARDLQFVDGQWIKGKCLDTFAPVGPAIVTKDEIPAPDRLQISLSVNGRVAQEGSTSDMIFGLSKIISFLSTFCTLEPGDVIATGTPPGVALGRGPEYYLKAGDVMVAEIECIGRLQNSVADRSL